MENHALYSYYPIDNQMIFYLMSSFDIFPNQGATFAGPHLVSFRLTGTRDPWAQGRRSAGWSM